MTVAVHVRSQDIPPAWLHFPRDPLGLRPRSEPSGFSAGTTDPCLSLCWA